MDSAVRPPGRVPERKGQDSNISPIWGEAPTAPIETKICVVGHLAEVITYATFQDDSFGGYDFTEGRISHYPIDFCMGLTTVQRDYAACTNFVSFIIIIARFGVFLQIPYFSGRRVIV